MTVIPVQPSTIKLITWNTTLTSAQLLVQMASIKMIPFLAVCSVAVNV